MSAVTPQRNDEPGSFERTLEVELSVRSVRLKAGAPPVGNATLADATITVCNAQDQMARFRSQRFLRLISRPGSPPPIYGQCHCCAAVRFCVCGCAVCFACEAGSLPRAGFFARS